jgi:hypothetical protein
MANFLRNDAPDIAAMDLLVVPSIGFKLPYGFVIVRIDCISALGLTPDWASKVDRTLQQLTH